MTDEIEKRLAEIEARANAATPGPWVADPRGGGVVRGGAVVHKARGSGQPQIAMMIVHEEEPSEMQAINVAFVANARQDVPWLVEQLRAARAEVERLSACRDLLHVGCAREADELQAKLERAESLLRSYETPAINAHFARRPERTINCSACDDASVDPNRVCTEHT